MMPLVSVIIPTWNHLPELLECLKSLARQTYTTFEVIVVDDGSTDGTAERMQGYMAPFPLRVHLMPHNRGAAAARNEGAKLAKGEGLLFLDADAVLVPHAIQQMVQVLLDHPEAAFAYSSFRFGWKQFRSRAFDVAELRKRPYIHTTSLMRKAAFPQFDESLKKFQDWDLWLTIAERGGMGIWIPEELFRIKVRREGMSRWFPSFFHVLPWQWIGWMPQEIERYRHWMKIIKQKHHIEG